MMDEAAAPITPEDTVPLNDRDLNAKLPSYAITRWWTEDDPTGIYGENRIGDKTTISRNYWENAIKVQDYLERLDVSGILERALQTPEGFQKLLKKLHVIQTQGLSRKNSYNGQSSIPDISEGWQEQFRNPERRIRATLWGADLDLIMSFLKNHDNDPDRFRMNFGTLTIPQFPNTRYPLDVYIPPPTILYPISQDIIARTAIDHFAQQSTVTDRSFLMACITDDAFRTETPELTGKKVMIIIYPSAKYIPEYLEKTRTAFQKVFSEKDVREQQHALANGYQAGIRSQAFETVWNSEMMGLVNFMLKRKLGKKPIPHQLLDYFAFLTSQKGFERYFDGVIDQFNPPPQESSEKAVDPTGFEPVTP